jgi:hypothetical protein
MTLVPDRSTLTTPPSGTAAYRNNVVSSRRAHFRRNWSSVQERDRDFWLIR